MVFGTTPEKTAVNRSRLRCQSTHLPKLWGLCGKNDFINTTSDRNVLNVGLICILTFNIGQIWAVINSESHVLFAQLFYTIQ